MILVKNCGCSTCAGRRCDIAPDMDDRSWVVAVRAVLWSTSYVLRRDWWVGRCSSYTTRRAALPPALLPCVAVRRTQPAGVLYAACTTAHDSEVEDEERPPRRTMHMTRNGRGTRSPPLQLRSCWLFRRSKTQPPPPTR